MDVQREQRGGIPVFWAEAPGPFRAALVFRVGQADETLATRGITHLVEHLALFASSRRLREANGFVDLSRCVFHATGEPEEVLEWMRRCAEALGALPFERLPLERQILRAEADGRGGGGVEARLLDHRYGATGFGLANYLELGLRWLGEAEVAAWSAERFTRGAAAIWMTAPPPEDFALELPDGGRPPELPTEPLPHGFPVHVAEGTGGVALGAVGARSAALQAVFGIATDRLYERLRLELGLVYDPWGGYEHLSSDLAHVMLGATCPDDRAAAVRDELRHVIDDLGEHGPEEAELEEQRRTLARVLEAPESVLAELDLAATRHLTGLPPLSGAGHLEELGRLGPDDLRERFREALGSAILLTPDGTDGWDGLTEVAWPERDPVAGTAFTGRRAEGFEVRVAADGLSMIEPTGTGTLLWEEIVIAEYSPAHQWTFTGRNSWSLTVPFALLDDGRSAEQAVRERLPPGVEVPCGPTEDYLAVAACVDGLPGGGWSVANELRTLAQILRDGETPEVLVVSPTEDGHGLLALTSARVLWMHERQEGGGRFWELEDVDGAAVQKRVLRGARLELAVEPPQAFDLGDSVDEGERFAAALAARG